MIFAAAPSQSDFMKALIRDKAIQWNKVNAFHMDEYIGLEEDAPRGLATFKTASFRPCAFQKREPVERSGCRSRSRMRTLLVFVRALSRRYCLPWYW